MTEKQKIFEILRNYTKKHNISASSVILEEYADELLANDVILPPCKVGETLYFLYDNTFANRPNFKPYIYETSDWYFDIDQKGISILPRSIHSYKGKHHYYLGETVFLTKEDAEEKLKELGK